MDRQLTANRPSVLRRKHKVRHKTLDQATLQLESAASALVGLVGVQQVWLQLINLLLEPRNAPLLLARQRFARLTVCGALRLARSDAGIQAPFLLSAKRAFQRV